MNIIQVGVISNRKAHPYIHIDLKISENLKFIVGRLSAEITSFNVSYSF